MLTDNRITVQGVAALIQQYETNGKLENAPHVSRETPNMSTPRVGFQDEQLANIIIELRSSSGDAIRKLRDHAKLASTISVLSS